MSWRWFRKENRFRSAREQSLDSSRPDSSLKRKFEHDTDASISRLKRPFLNSLERGVIEVGHLRIRDCCRFHLAVGPDIDSQCDNAGSTFFAERFRIIGINSFKDFNWSAS